MSETRNEPVNIRVTKEEKQEIETNAKSQGLSVTSFLVWLNKQFTKKNQN